MEVGRISARLDAVFDDRNFDRFDRALKGARSDAKRDVRVDVGADVDTREFSKAEGLFRRLRGDAKHDAKVDVKADVDNSSFNRADRAMRSVDDNQKNLVRGSGRLKTSFGSLFFGGAGIAAGATAFYGLAKGVGFVTDAFAESERIGKQTEAVIKSTGGAANLTAKQVGDLATEISKYSGIDDEAVQSGENMLLTFTNIRNEAGKGNDVFNQTTKAAADMSTALGTDMKGAAMQLGKALNDPTAGVTKLQRSGVTFTEQQKEQIKTLQESGKTLAAQKIILGEVNKEFGGSAKAAGSTFSGSINKAKVAVGNLAEVVGGKLAPFLSKAANFVTKFANSLTSGAGSGNRFKAVFSAVGAVVRTIGNVFSSVFGFIGKVIKGNRATIDRFGDVIRSNFQAIVRFVRNVGESFNRVFGGGTGVGKDIRSIIKIVGNFAATVAEVAGRIGRRILPIISKAFEGVMQVVRGVIRVVSGLLRGDFGKAWDGAKDIVRGAIKAIGSILGGAGGLILSAVKKGFNAGLDFVGSLPGKFASIGKRMVSGIAGALKGLPGALAGVLSNIGNFMGDIGRGIANWINANTPFGDQIKVGPVHVRLPALARGGRPRSGDGAATDFLPSALGRAEVNRPGKGSGKLRAFITDEGRLPEWVISQEGDRASNVGYAKDALEALTGRKVELHKTGKGKKKKKTVTHKSPGDVLGTTGRRSVSRGEAGMKNFERDIQRMEREYDQLDRFFGQSDETILIENDDGSVSIDETARRTRNSELDQLTAKRKAIKDKIRAYKDAVKRAVDAYKAAIKKLNAAIKAAKGDVHKKDRAKYRDEIAEYQDRITELRDVSSSLGLDLTDQDLDINELAAEKGANNAMTASAAPTSDDPATTEDPATADPATAAATPAEIAAAAAEQLAAFQGSRADLFSSFGSNFANAGTSAFGDSTQQAAGMRYFGATSSGDAAQTFHDGAIAKQVNVTNNYESGPEDTLSYSRGLEFDISAAA